MPLDPTIDLLKSLVAIDSVNPSLVAGGAAEGAMARRIAEELAASGCAVHVTEVAPDRPNVVGVLEGAHPGRTLLLCGHTDTVGVAGMVRPFEATVREGRLYARGAQDMKGGLAAMLGAVRQLSAGGGLARGRVIVAAVVDEEHASLGAEALVQQWRADAAIVTEPTDLDVAVAHKGFQWLSVETRGRAAHGSRPRDGRDAILRMGRVLVALEALDRRLQERPAHPLLGPPSLHASTVQGGSELSTYPDRSWLEFERRTVPGESADVGLQEIRQILDTLRRADAEFEGDARLVFAREAYRIADDSPVPQALRAAAAACGCPARVVGMSFWTDAAILGSAGIPTVVFGPGGAGLHGPDEYVRLLDVQRCRDALVVFAQAFLAA